MCDTCGCSDSDAKYTIRYPTDSVIQNSANNQVSGHEHGHGHGHGHGFDYAHGHTSKNRVEIGVPVLNKNQVIAERNRSYFLAKNIKAYNLVSSPGSGKTSLLERIIKLNAEKNSIYVIEGDQQTSNDARRIEVAGAIAIQINTGNGCHLDAEMVADAENKLNLPENSVLFIENVGNLVCPALFDLGENSRIIVASVTEGDDKPLKYPNMFETSQLCVINKADLLPYVDFSVEQFMQNALRVNHHLRFIEVSAKTGTGMENLLAQIYSL